MAKKEAKKETKKVKFELAGTANLPELTEAVTTLVGEEVKQDTVRAVFTAIQNLNAQRFKVAITGFGTFEPRFRNAKKGRNPQTGAEIEIAETVIPALKTGKTYKDAVAEGTVVEPKLKAEKKRKVAEVEVTEDEAPKKDKKDKKKDKKKSKK